MKSLKEIIDENTEPIEFPLCNRIYTISPERRVYGEIRKKYNELGHRALLEFKQCVSELRDLDELISSIPSAFLVSIDESLDELSKDAISVGCYTYDSNTILNECTEHDYFKRFQDAYSAYVERDENITCKLSNASKYRKIRKDNRARWTSATINGDICDAWATGKNQAIYAGFVDQPAAALS